MKIAPVEQVTTFKTLKTAVAAQFQRMLPTGLFHVDIEKDMLWQSYLNSFPEGSNPLYQKRTEHDCSCCRGFIRTLGSVVTIVNGEMVSLWDISVGGPYQAVADAMSALVKQGKIDNAFLHTEKTVGVSANRQLLADTTVKTWEHFFVNLSTAVVAPGPAIGPKLAESRSTYDVMLRSLQELSVESIGMVLDLIAQNSLYRGEEQQFAVSSFLTLKREFDALTPEARELFVWSHVGSTPQSVSRIRNTAIGTMLTDLSGGMDIEDAVKAFELKVAPANYKRPTALVTKRMIADAQVKVNELGLASALERRYATIDDITINNILFADRTAKKAMNVFDDLASRIPESKKALDRVEEVPVEKFFADVLPTAESLEIMFENRHANNLVSLVTAGDPTSKLLFKWPNRFSWSYVGDLTDSIKERVKRAGGQVEADLRCSLSWFNYDDLDLHLTEPGGNEIYYAKRLSALTRGQLDVDMNAGSGTTRSAVENIFYPSKERMRAGTYILAVHNFCLREKSNVGFEAEIEFGGVVHSFSYDKPVRDKETIEVARFKYDKNGFEIVSSLPSTQSSKTIWSVPTQVFHRANVVMLSPNHWDNLSIGNKHYFFMLEGCRNEGVARGFYNEFLTEELSKHRKVFEIVGAKMKTEESDRQLSGLGFSSTQRNQLLCRVKGSLTRTIKVIF
jgi:hypothetical protein